MKVSVSLASESVSKVKLIKERFSAVRKKLRDTIKAKNEALKQKISDNKVLLKTKLDESAKREETAIAKAGGKASNKKDKKVSKKIVARGNRHKKSSKK